MSLGLAVTLLRTAKGMGRRDLSKAAGISYPYLSEIEVGHKEPSLKVLYALSGALGLTAAELCVMSDEIAAKRDIVIPSRLYAEG